MRGKYFESFDGAKIYYDKKEVGENFLVFLHGLGGDLTAWDQERQYFENLGLSTLAMDLRGHGFSERRNDKDFFKFENFAKDLDLLLKREGIDNAVIIGHCFGGMVAIYFQAQILNHSKGLVLVDTSYKPAFFGKNFVPKVLINKMIDLLLKVSSIKKVSGHEKDDQFKGSSDIDLKRLLSDILHTSLRSYLLVFKSMVNLDEEDILRKILVPTLVIEGSQDTIFPPNLAEDLSKRIKKSYLEFIEGANHILVLNNPKGLEGSIQKFLTKIKF